MFSTRQFAASLLHKQHYYHDLPSKILDTREDPIHRRIRKNQLSP